MHALTCVHAQYRQILGWACPSIAAGHALLSIQLGPHLQRPGEEVGNGLPCCSIVVHSQLQPCEPAQDVTGQGDYAVPSFLVFDGVWQQVQDGPCWQLIGNQTRH